MSIDIRGLPQPRAEQPRTETKRVRLSRKEAEAQEKAAKDAGMTWSEWVRWLAAGYLGEAVNPPALPWVGKHDPR